MQQFLARTHVQQDNGRNAFWPIIFSFPEDKQFPISDNKLQSAG